MNINSFASAVANPGVFEAGGSPWFLPTAVALALFAIGGIVMFGFAAADRPRAVVASIVLAFVGLVGTIGFGIAGDTHAEQEIDVHHRAVSSWLSDTYGIDTTAEQASRLTNGEQFVVDYDGHPITVSVIETLDGDLSIIDEARKPLAASR